MAKVVDHMLSWRDLQGRYGITSMTLYRWRNDPKVNFPKPDVMIKDRPYWSETRTIQTWERSTVARRRA
jgi:predicted DNA-binding transcriptional regulator AlpA